MFKPAARYPADPRAVFILALSVFSGITALLLQAAPDTLDGLLPRWGVVIWGVTLAVGSLITLAGMRLQSVNGIITEQIGSVTVGVACLFYSGLVVWSTDAGGVQITGMVLAWGLACFFRWAQLQALIRSEVKRREKRAHIDALHAEIERRAAKAEERAKSRRWR